MRKILLKMREKMRQLKMSIFLLHFWTFHLKKSKCATFWVLAHCARFKKRCARGLGSTPQTQSPKLEARAGCLASSPRPARGSKPSSRVDARRGSARQAPSSARPELAKRPAWHTSNQDYPRPSARDVPSLDSRLETRDSTGILADSSRLETRSFQTRLGSRLDFCRLDSTRDSFSHLSLLLWW